MRAEQKSKHITPRGDRPERAKTFSSNWIDKGLYWSYQSDDYRDYYPMPPKKRIVYADVIYPWGAGHIACGVYTGDLFRSLHDTKNKDCFDMARRMGARIIFPQQITIETVK